MHWILLSVKRPVIFFHTSCGVAIADNGVKDVGGDGLEELADDGGVDGAPVRVVRHGEEVDGAVDVVEEIVLAKEEAEVRFPREEVGRGMGELDRHTLEDGDALSRSLYRLKQAPHAWYQRMAAFLQQLGFRSTRSIASLFVFRQGSDAAYLLLYVDDIILTACNNALLGQLTDLLRAEFAIKDLGPLHYFLCLEVVRPADGFFLH
jgi:hypothetical protein